MIGRSLALILSHVQFVDVQRNSHLLRSTFTIGCSPFDQQHAKEPTGKENRLKQIASGGPEALAILYRSSALEIKI